ncbi:hypothetical protein NV379_02530 [Paenibacillus sp. N1-5-1-14]|uniref:hypothetical protein n=1 Tax=Paenibacillus radicibacter TaxID=2972488 RepID=UPI002159B57A|nr:hypothetical protein [Paenibacillus radicibacter]MCR8641523.1 hypothetical protein [Paenibacillus radicibacter]
MSYSYVNQTTIGEKVDYLSDLLAEVITKIEYTAYQNMTSEQQDQVKENFHALLKKENIILTSEIIEAAEKEFSNSPIVSLLRQYGYAVKQGSIFSESANELKSGRKVTLIKFSEFGFPVLINTVIDRTEIKPYAQYNESLKIIHKPKRKRSLFSNTILPYQELLIYDGWLETDIKMMTHETIKEAKNIKLEQSKYCSFDKSFFEDILQYIKVKPIAAVNLQY